MCVYVRSLTEVLLFIYCLVWFARRCHCLPQDGDACPDLPKDGPGGLGLETGVLFVFLVVLCLSSVFFFCVPSVAHQNLLVYLIFLCVFVFAGDFLWGL